MKQYTLAFIITCIFDWVKTFFAIRYIRHVRRINGVSTKNIVLAIIAYGIFLQLQILFQQCFE